MQFFYEILPAMTKADQYNLFVRNGVFSPIDVHDAFIVSQLDFAGASLDKVTDCRRVRGFQNLKRES